MSQSLEIVVQVINLANEEPAVDRRLRAGDRYAAEYACDTSAAPSNGGSTRDLSHQLMTLNKRGAQFNFHIALAQATKLHRELIG